MEKAVKLGLIGASIGTTLLIAISIVLPFIHPAAAQAQFYPQPGSVYVKDGAQQYFTPKPCTSGQGGKPSNERKGSYCPDLSKSDPNAKDVVKYACANSYDKWIEDPNSIFGSKTRMSLHLEKVESVHVNSFCGH